MRKLTVVLATLLAIASATEPAGAATVKGTANANNFKVYFVTLPAGEAQLVATATYKQASAITLIAVECYDLDDTLLMTAASVSTLPKTHRAELGVFGDFCLVGIITAAGKASFTMNVRAAPDTTFGLRTPAAAEVAAAEGYRMDRGRVEALLEAVRRRE